MDYLQNAKHCLDNYDDGYGEVHATSGKLSALIAIAEQLKRIADNLDRFDVSHEGGIVVTATIQQKNNESS